ncbi:MAG: hypothetical protein RLZZ568_91 [Cyanobacteriota bacterium]
MNEKLRKKLKPEHFELIERLKKLGFTVEAQKKGAQTLRIKKNGYNYGYINKNTVQKNGLFGYRFNLSPFLTDQKTFDHCPHSIVGEGDVENALENYFFKKYGFRDGWHLEHNKSKGKFYVTINDIKLAELILGIDKKV